MSELDTLNLNYAHVQSEFSNGPASSLYKIDTATLRWSRMLTTNLSAELGGGGILISPGLTTYAANAALIMNFQNNSATISYLHSAFPSYVDTGEPLIGDRFSLSAIQMIDRKWQLSETANYMHTTGGAGIERNTYFASAGLNYWITGIWSTSLNYQYMYNSYSQSGSSSDNFDRHAIMFSVNTSWE